MLLWISLALLSAGVALLLLRPAARAAAASAPGLGVYRQQLDELEADAGNGLIPASEAETARAEIARRLLKEAAAQQAAGCAEPAGLARRSETILTVSAIVIPLAALALYMIVGSPHLPGQPLAERLARTPNRASAEDLVAKVEQRLRAKPDDAQGWAVIGPVYLRMGRFADAVEAFGRSIELAGETPDRLLGLANAMIFAANGTVTEPALKVLDRLAKVAPDRLETRFWKGVHAEQNGRKDEAIAIYRDLLAASPPDAPWRSALEERLAELTGVGTAPGKPSASATPNAAPGPQSPVLAPLTGPKSATLSGPTPAEFVAAARKLEPPMRAQMIGRMIDKATVAVRANPKDTAAWSRIVTGQMALDNKVEAKRALDDARSALSGEAAAQAELDALAKSLGLAP